MPFAGKLCITTTKGNPPPRNGTPNESIMAGRDISLTDPARYNYWIEDHVRFSDLDPLGHVNNLSVGQYFENARVALFSQLFPKWPLCEQLFVLAHIDIDFLRELHYPAK